MQYTVQNLKTQLELKKQNLLHEQLALQRVKSVDWPLAIEYGEEVRENHIRTIQNRISHLEGQIKDLVSRIPIAP